MKGPASRSAADIAVQTWFESHRTLRAVIEAVLEGRLGRIVLAGDPAAAARLDLGCYAIFGGDPATPSTRPDARGLGLARAVAAALVTFCLDEGLSPEWSAANPISKRLALSLGYRPAALCDVFYLGPEA